MSSFTIAEIKKAISKHNKEEDKKVKVMVENGRIKFSSGGAMSVAAQSPASQPNITMTVSEANNKVDAHKRYLKQLKKKVKDLTPAEKTKYNALAKASSRAKKK